ncbi:unnamed protein product, partial [marine sediment metagenome]
MKPSLYRVLILGLIISFEWLGCSEKKEEIKIGVLSVLTGEAALYGVP